MTKRQRTSAYKEFLFKHLKSPRAAAGYLTESFEEGEETFFLVLKDVAEAHGGIAPLAKATNLNREGLYDMLSDKGNPRLSSLSTVLDALGIKVEFRPQVERRKAV